MAINEFRQTKQDFEAQFGINHIGHAYLSLLLTPLLEKSNGRIVMLASSAHRRTEINDMFGQINKSKKGPTKESYNIQFFDTF